MIKLKRASVADMKKAKKEKVDQRVEYNDDVRIFLEDMKIFEIKNKKIIKMLVKVFADLTLPRPG